MPRPVCVAEGVQGIIIGFAELPRRQKDRARGSDGDVASPLPHGSRAHGGAYVVSRPCGNHRQGRQPQRLGDFRIGKTGDVVLVPEKERKSLDELTLRIFVNSAEGDKVRVNLPMTLVKIGLELGIDLAPKYADRDLIAMSNLDLSKIVELAERGALGKLVEVESADGDIVEVVVE